MRPSTGFAIRDHTADARVEAWAPTRSECLRQAALGLVATFAAPPDDGSATTPVEVPLPDEDDAALVTLLEEVVYRLDTEDVVAVDVEVTPRVGGGMHARLHVAPLHAVGITGAAPKAIAWSDLSLARSDDGSWWSRFIVDV